jgi:hypothetical protein
LPAPVENLLFSRHGLRAIWRCVVYLAIFTVCFEIVIPSIQPRLPVAIPLLSLRLFVEVELALAAILPTLFMARMEERPWGDYGLPLANAFGKCFWVGAVWGLASITVLMLAIACAGGFQFGSLALHGSRALKFALFWGLMFLVVGVFEEFLLRGYLQYTLTEAVGFWPSAVLLSAGFGAWHWFNPGENWLGSMAAGLLGLFFCLTLRRTGNLWFAVGFHAAWDWGESYLYSVPDSGQRAARHLMNSSFHGSRWLTGGAVGPEGSLLVFVVIALVWPAFILAYPVANYPRPSSDRLAES